MSVESCVAEVVAEMTKARARYPAFGSLHEGASVITEERDEFWEEIKKNSPENARRECVQLAAMALRFLVDFEFAKKNFASRKPGEVA